MIINRKVIADQIVDYLNGRLSLASLVDWGENTFIDDVLEPEDDIPLLNDILGYLAAADTAQFPLTWAICSDFLHRLGYAVTVTAEPA